MGFVGSWVFVAFHLVCWALECKIWGFGLGLFSLRFRVQGVRFQGFQALLVCRVWHWGLRADPGLRFGYIN